MAGQITALLDSLSPEEFASLCTDLGVELTATPAEDPAAGQEGAEEAPPDSSEAGPPSSQQDLTGGVPTAEDMSTAAQACASEAAATVDWMTALVEQVGEADKAAAKKIDKLVGDAEKLLKDAEKAGEAAQRAASKEDVGAAAEAAGEAEVTAKAIEELKAEAQQIADGADKPEPEEGAEGEQPAAPKAAAAPAKPKAVSPFEAWASRGA